jgi:hypothetical protein
VATTARHRGSPSGRWFPVVGSALLGAALGAGATTAVLVPTSSAQRPPTTASSTAPLPRSPEVVRAPDPVAFAPPFTDAAGMSLTVLRPEKIKGGVRFTIAVANTSDAPIVVDTGALGPHEPTFNDVAVPMTMTPVRTRLAPGEGYTYQCILKLPTMDLGRVAFSISQTAISGQAAGD